MFCYARSTVETLFYFLSVVQIAMGLYLVWQGLQWLGYARRRAATDPGFYAPRTAVLCSCKGLEPGLERNQRTGPYVARGLPLKGTRAPEVGAGILSSLEAAGCRRFSAADRRGAASDSVIKRAIVTR